MRSTLALTFALAASFAAATAPAAASGNSVSIIVPTHDLNLTSAAGQRTLEGRINRAARQICATGERSLSAISAENACIAEARASAAEQMSGATTIALVARSPRG